MASNNARTQFFMTPVGRFVYPHLDVKRTKDWQGKDLKPEDQYYDVTILFPKTAATREQCRNWVAIATKIMECAAQQPGWGGTFKPGAYWPLLDCDIRNNDREQGAFAEKNAWAARHWRISANSTYPPVVVDQNNQDLPKDLRGNFLALKGGDWGIASINCYASSTASGSVGFGLEGIKKVADGDPVGGGQRSPEQIFGGSAPAAPQTMGAPAAPPIPQQTQNPYPPVMPAPAPGAYGAHPSGHPGLGAVPGNAGPPQHNPEPPRMQPSPTQAPGYPQQAPPSPQGYPAAPNPGAPAPGYGPTATYPSGPATAQYPSSQMSTGQFTTTPPAPGFQQAQPSPYPPQGYAPPPTPGYPAPGGMPPPPPIGTR